MNTPPANSPAPVETILLADILPNGSGGFAVKAAQPALEVSSATAAKILGVSRSSVGIIIKSPLASRVIKWRWLSPKHGKRLFNTASLVAYRQALEHRPSS